MRPRGLSERSSVEPVITVVALRAPDLARVSVHPGASPQQQTRQMHVAPTANRGV
jgi:hypothetical protein